MPRKRVKSKRREKKNVVPAWQQYFLCFGIMPEDTGGAERGWVLRFTHDWGTFMDDYFPKDPAEAWKTCGSELLRQWIKERPGTRPWAWWHFDAPRWNNPRYERLSLPEPRKRLGGTGTPNFECLAYVPAFEFGVPKSWVGSRIVDLYNGRNKNTHGNAMCSKYIEGYFKALPVNPDDPPIYETEASYLKRQGLLTEEERQLDLDYTGHVSVVDLAFLSTDDLRKNKEFFLQHPKH